MAGASECNGYAKEKKEPRIIVIGAGISGIGAANMLCQEGFNDIVVIEATDRIGGRIWSLELESENGLKVELGANWIHGIELNPIYCIAIKHNLLSTQYKGRNLGKKMIFLTETGDPVHTRIIGDVDLHYGMLISECEEFYKQQIPTPFEDDSVGAYVEREFEDKISRYVGEEHRMRELMITQRLLGECIISGAHTMHDVALSEVGCFEELEGVHYVIPAGFDRVVHMLKKSIPPERILLNHPVTLISWKSQGVIESGGYPVCVECENGEKFSGDICLITVSLGYLKQHGDRLFWPRLPELKQKAIQNIAMGTVNKVILEFDGQVLPNEIFRLEMVWDRRNTENEDIAQSWIKKIPSFEAISENVLMGWLSGREAEYMEKLSDEEVGKRCVEVLTAFLRKTIRKMPNLKKVTRSFWKSNPYTLGSYCHIPVGTEVADIDRLGEPVCNDKDEPVLLFAGEATHPKFYSSSHGALLSGEREAKRIINLYRR